MAGATSQGCACNYAYSSAKVFPVVLPVLKSVFSPWWLLLASMHSLLSSSNFLQQRGLHDDAEEEVHRFEAICYFRLISTEVEMNI